MGVMDLYPRNSTQPAGYREGDFCRYDEGAGTTARLLLQEAGATDEMIDTMSKEDAQNFIMANDDKRTEIIHKFEEDNRAIEVEEVTRETARNVGKVPVRHTLMNN